MVLPIYKIWEEPFLYLKSNENTDLSSSTTNITKKSTTFNASSIKCLCPRVNGLQFMTIEPTLLYLNKSKL